MGFLRRLFGPRTGSVAHLEELLRTTDAADPQRDSLINDLAAALSREFQVRGDRRNLDRAVVLLTEALARNAGGPELRRAALFTNYGVALRLRAGLDGTAADLARSVESLTNAEQLIQAGHPQRALVCSELGTALAELFEHDADLSTLDRAIALHEESVAAAGENVTFMNNLGAAHVLRFQRTGDVHNRERAIGVLNAAIAQGGWTANAATNLGEVFRLRYGSTQAPDDIVRSIELTERAIRDSYDTDPHQPGRLINLGLAHESRGDLTAALTAYTKAVSLLADRPTHPWRSEAESRAELVRVNLGER